jgi:hypothetical protein
MPNRSHYALVGKELRRRLNGKAFTTVPRREITDILREVSEEPTTRIKSNVAWELSQVLLEKEALRCYPSLEETDSQDNVRIFRAGSVFGNLVDLIAHPDPDADKEVGEMLAKIKGKWHWSTPAPGVDEPAGQP